MDYPFKIGEIYKNRNGAYEVCPAITDAAPFHFANPPDSGFRFLWDEDDPSRHTVAERLQRLEQVPLAERLVPNRGHAERRGPTGRSPLRAYHS